MHNLLELIADLPMEEFKKCVLCMTPGEHTAFSLFMAHRIDQYHAQALSEKEQLEECSEGINPLLNTLLKNLILKGAKPS